MRRVASSLVTLWVGFFIPSFLLWGGMLRWSPSAADRFQSIWQWTADRLAFPLLLAPLNQSAWSAIEDGTALSATGGFVYLTSLWALMLTAPLALIGVWWGFMTRRHTTTAAVATTSDTEPLSLTSPTTQPAPSPLGAIHVLTIPIALLWLGVVRFFMLFRRPPGSTLSFLAPIILLSALTFLLVAGLLALWFPRIGYHEWNEVRILLASDIWLGYLDRVYLPVPIEERFYDYVWSMEQIHDRTPIRAWPEYVSNWYRHPEQRNIVFFLAVRHALGVAIVVTFLQILRRAFGK